MLVFILVEILYRSPSDLLLPAYLTILYVSVRLPVVVGVCDLASLCLRPILVSNALCRQLGSRAEQ